jgi:hypothetical protein
MSVPEDRRTVGVEVDESVRRKFRHRMGHVSASSALLVIHVNLGRFQFRRIIFSNDLCISHEIRLSLFENQDFCIFIIPKRRIDCQQKHANVSDGG